MNRIGGELECAVEVICIVLIVSSLFQVISERLGYREAITKVSLGFFNFKFQNSYLKELISTSNLRER